MEDIYKYSRNIKSKEILNSDSILLRLGGVNRKGLIQGAQLNYGRNVSVRFEAGTSDLYYVDGQPSGTFGCESLLGKRGFFETLNNSGCGQIEQLNMSVNSGKCGIEVSGDSRINIGGAIVTNIGVNFSTGGMDIRESLQYMVAHVSKDS